MWTYEIVLNTDKEARIRYTNNNITFEKRHMLESSLTQAELEQFAQNHADGIGILEQTFNQLKSMINVEQTIADGWTFKFTYISMPADWLELFVDVYSPYGVLTKNYSTQSGRTTEFIQDFIDAEKQKLIDMIGANDLEGLSAYFDVNIGGE